jgi:hypothetical protein
MNHAVRDYCPHGGSIADRWMRCPGSVRLCRSVAARESVYASEGTHAHEEAQRCFETHCHTNDPELALYVDHCRNLMELADRYWIEQPVSLESFNAPAPMWGTLDFAAYISRRRELHIVDLKYDKGVWVNAKGNTQLEFYTLGAIALVNAFVVKVLTTIIQPRFQNADPIRSAVLDPVELAEFSIELMAAAKKTLEPDAPAVTGSHCKFCPAQTACLAYQNLRQQKAYHEFKLETSSLKKNVTPAFERRAEAVILTAGLKG